MKIVVCIYQKSPDTPALLQTLCETDIIGHSFFLSDLLSINPSPSATTTSLTIYGHWMISLSRLAAIQSPTPILTSGKIISLK